MKSFFRYFFACCTPNTAQAEDAPSHNTNSSISTATLGPIVSTATTIPDLTPSSNSEACMDDSKASSARSFEPLELSSYANLIDPNPIVKKPKPKNQTPYRSLIKSHSDGNLTYSVQTIWHIQEKPSKKDIPHSISSPIAKLKK